MAKLYHYTGLYDLIKALEYDSVKSELTLGAMRSAHHNDVSYEEAHETLVHLLIADGMDPMELNRRSRVHLLRDKEDDGYSRHSYQELHNESMVVLGFDVPDSMVESDSRVVGIPGELSLQYLVEVYAQEKIIGITKERLETHNKNVPVMMWGLPKPIPARHKSIIELIRQEMYLGRKPAEYNILEDRKNPLTRHIVYSVGAGVVTGLIAFGLLDIAHHVYYHFYPIAPVIIGGYDFSDVNEEIVNGINTKSDMITSSLIGLNAGLIEYARFLKIKYHL